MAGPITPGEMIHSVRFERRAVTTNDGFGNTLGEWQTLIDKRSAKLTPTRPSRSGDEAVIAARQQGVAIWDLWVRSDSETRGVTTDDRVVDRRDPNRTFNVKFTGDLDGDRRFLLMQLEQGTADG